MAVEEMSGSLLEASTAGTFMALGRLAALPKMLHHGHAPLHAALVYFSQSRDVRENTFIFQVDHVFFKPSS